MRTKHSKVHVNDTDLEKHLLLSTTVIHSYNIPHQLVPIPKHNFNAVVAVECSANCSRANKGVLHRVNRALMVHWRNKFNAPLRLPPPHLVE